MCQRMCQNISRGQISHSDCGCRIRFSSPVVIQRNRKSFYEAHRISKGWEDEFDYVAWIYDVAFGDVLVGIKFMRSRHLAMTFILNIYSTDSNYMWKPTREELLAAGVITG